jgi:nicotinate-nucleotide adenylyltransferase
VRRDANLETVWLMPNAEPPHRAHAAAPAADRLAMVRLAVEGIAGLSACDLELERGGRSYTIDSLRILQGRYPERSFALLLGADQAATIQRWHEPAAVIAAVDVIIFNRREDQLTAEQAYSLGFDPRRTHVLSIQTPPIAAHEIRRRVAEGLPVDELVPDSVARYITAHRLYRPKTRMG